MQGKCWFDPQTTRQANNFTEPEVLKAIETTSSTRRDRIDRTDDRRDVWQLGYGWKSMKQTCPTILIRDTGHQRTWSCILLSPRDAFWLRAPRDCDPVMKAVGEEMDFQLRLLDEVPEADRFMKLRSSLAQLRCWFGVLWWVGQIGQACAVSYDDVQLLVDATHPNPKHVLGVQAGIFLPKQAVVASSNIYSRLEYCAL